MYKPGKRVFLCGTDFSDELGECPSGTVVYPTLDDAKKHNHCWEGCGLYEVEVNFVKIAVAGNRSKQTSQIEPEHWKRFEAASRASIVTRYQIKDIIIELRDGSRTPALYAVHNGHGLCLNSDNQLEWEPKPSSRTDEFLKRTRFDLEDAMIRAYEFVNTRDRSLAI